MLKLRTLLLLCVVPFGPAPAHAQFEPLAFAICRKIPADTARLKCFDEIGASKSDGSSLSAPAVQPGWQFTVDKSPLDDSSQVTAILPSKDGANLVLRCKERKTEAVFVPSGFFVSGTGDTIPIILRINDNPPASFAWHKSTNGSSAFAPDAIGFIRLLPENGKLFIRATGFQGRLADGSFELADVSSARTKIEEACNWSTPKGSKLDVPKGAYGKSAREGLKSLIDGKAAGTR